MNIGNPEVVEIDYENLLQATETMLQLESPRHADILVRYADTNELLQRVKEHPIKGQYTFNDDTGKYGFGSGHENGRTIEIVTVYNGLPVQARYTLK